MNNEQYNGKITAFSLLPNGSGAVIKFTDNPIENNEPTPKEITHKVLRKPSENLYMVLRSLLGHAIYYCGWSFGKLTDKELQSRKVVDMPEFSSYTFLGFQLKGDDEDEKITIEFAKSLETGETIKLKTPGIPIASGEYVFDDILSSDLQQIINELRLFLAGKNYFVQARIMFPEPKEQDSEGEFEDELEDEL